LSYLLCGLAADLSAVVVCAVVVCSGEVIAASVDSHFSHLAWTQQSRKMGGLGAMDIPIISDLQHTVSKDYGVYLEEEGHTLRGLFIIDDKGILKHITHNSPEAGRNVDETLRLVQAYQYAAVVSPTPSTRFFRRFCGQRVTSAHRQSLIFCLCLFCLCSCPLVSTARFAPPDGSRVRRPSSPTRLRRSSSSARSKVWLWSGAMRFL